MIIDFLLYASLIVLYALTLAEMRRIHKDYVLMVYKTTALEARICELEGGDRHAG